MSPFPELKFGYYMIYDSISHVSLEDAYRLAADSLQAKKKTLNK